MSMIPSVFDKRPPFVRFEEREMGLNAEETEKAGRPIPRVIIMACITPHGSKDVHEKPAEEYIKQLKEKAMRGEYPVEWYNHMDLTFSEWKKGNELPREGTPIRTWQMISRMDATRLIATGVTIVEDLAEFPDSNLSVIGLNGRYLRDTARAWINEAKDKGANAKALADANVKISDLEARNVSLVERLERLEQRLESAEESRGRRGKKADSEAA